MKKFTFSALFVLAWVTVATAQETVDFRQYQPKESSRVRENTEWSTTYTFDTLDTTHPRLCLIGDSICNGYNGKVRELLRGELNVTFWASSKCVTDPNYFRELDLILSSNEYSIISFNNGLHSLTTDITEWENAYRVAVKFIRAKCPNAKLYLTLCTPLKDPELTAKSRKLNEITRKIAEEEQLPVIDLFRVMDSLDRNEFWSDTYHFKQPAIQIQAETIRDTVLQ